jgi:Protein of unknown function (DUF1153)
MTRAANSRTQKSLALAQLLEAAQSATFRWVPSRKAVLVEAVRRGEVSQTDAEKRFGVSPAELTSWAHSLDQHGIPGLRQTKLHIYNPQRLRQR